MPIFTITILGKISAILIIGLKTSSALLPLIPHPKTQRNLPNLLPTLPTEAPLNTLPTTRRHIPILLHRAPLILDLHFLFLNRQVTRHVRPGDFAAVGAVTQVAARTREELAVGDCDADRAAETSRGERFGEGGGVVGVWVAG
jgi:hypothetical protein